MLSWIGVYKHNNNYWSKKKHNNYSYKRSLLISEKLSANNGLQQQKNYMSAHNAPFVWWNYKNFML